MKKRIEHNWKFWCLDWYGTPRFICSKCRKDTLTLSEYRKFNIPHDESCTKMINK